ncbi:helix-turn-helix domain-containing protein [Streptomyces ossamyceticus]|uniref:AraC-like ligand-binding domain-containing protein n=1 Tax=Streptomyces ossamyceticus TaxID=249581 RepID=UPI0006E367AE|nr:helix-turn-helix domain-containing protein [Streptomyces ossamyceticus]
MRTVVTTEQVSPDERFDFWVEEMARLMVAPLDTTRTATDVFHGTAATGRVGALRLSALSAGPLRVRRTESSAARHEEDFYKLALQVSGSVVIEQDGVRSRLTPGDLALCDTSRAYGFTYESPFSTVLVLVPRPLIPLRPETLRAVTGRRMAPDQGVGAVVAPFLRSLTEQSAHCAGPEVSRLADGAVSLVTALLCERLNRAAPVAPHLATMLRIRDYIERHLADPDLTPDVIAGAHGISRRYLFKLFAEEETTVAGWIRTRRLERCARDLADPATRDQPVAAIAARWGLLDGRHFARVFKAVYGETPRDYRRRAGRGQAPLPPGPNPAPVPPVPLGG